MLGEYGLNIDYIVIALVGAILILLILIISLMISIKRLKKRYKRFMTGSDGKNLEERFEEKFDSLNTIVEENKAIKVALKKLNEIHKASFTKIGIVHYDAFNETSVGKLSFAIALLNEENNGVIMNSVYSTRGGCYLYAKEVINAEAFKVLTKEEKTALNEALANEK